MPEPIVVVVRRGSVVEARHRVHAVVVRDGQVVETAGEPGLVSFLRSSSKPIQALPLARAREDLDDRQLAIACASHRAQPAQLDAVRRLLADAPARERELECGIQEGRPPDALHHNCSGKHAGMLALCRARGWRSEGYRHEAHRVQRAMAAAHAEVAGIDEDSLPTAIDGCGVVTFALSLERTARAFGRLAELRGGERVAAAMRGHPELVGGAGQADTELMRALPGWIAKGGAEGLMCAAGDGIAVAMKVEDGISRPMRPALHAVFGRIGLELPADFARVPVRNAHGEEAGEIVSAT
jgi:L-asparaginase II